MSLKSSLLARLLELSILTEFWQVLFFAQEFELGVVFPVSYLIVDVQTITPKRATYFQQILDFMACLISN